MPGADRDPRHWACYTMSGNTSSRRVVLHWTASPRTASPKSQADYMHQGTGSTGYHLIVPVDDNGYRPLQLRPAGCGAGSLKNTGDLHTSPNKQGSVLVQVAMVCTTGDDPFTKGPGPWWPQVLDWLDGWGIPRQYVAGDWNANRVMSTSDWYSAKSGYTAHKQVPEIPNTPRKPDPGPVNSAVMWDGAVPSPPPTQPPSSTRVTIDVKGSGTVTVRMLKPTSPIMKGEDVRAAQQLLKLRGHAPADGRTDGQYGTNSVEACKRFQKAQRLQTDGWVGSKTWDALLNG